MPLAGYGRAEARRAAERVWSAVQSETVDGLNVTMSYGVAATAPGAPCDLQARFCSGQRRSDETASAKRTRQSSSRRAAYRYQ